MARTCVFCGGAPVTAEHAMPDWVGKLFTNEVVDFSRTLHYPDREPEVRPWKGKPFSATVKVVCGGCNHGWMSRLENQAAPILTPLMRGEDRRLDAVEQHLIATWAVKTMLMLRLVASDGDDRELARDMYAYLAAYQSPPSGQQVWIGTYAGEGQWPMIFNYLAAGIAPPEGEEPCEPNAHCASFAVGHLAVALAGNRLEHGPMAVQRNPPDTWRAIWPTDGASIDFPPPAALAGDSEMYTFAVPAEWRSA